MGSNMPVCYTMDTVTVTTPWPPPEDIMHHLGLGGTLEQFDLACQQGARADDEIP